MRVTRITAAPPWLVNTVPVGPRIRSLLAAPVILVLGLCLPAGAHASTSCAHGGAPANMLLVTVSGRSEAVITRRGQEIVAGDYEKPPVACAGDTPTVLNTDTINVLFVGEDLPSAEVLLANGPMAPGATAEPEGASEIEIRVAGPGVYIDIVGTAGGDEFRWGSGGPDPGLNVNPREAGDVDVDVTVVGDFDAPLLYAELGAGNDTITGNAGLSGGSVYANGGSGDDVMTAPRGAEADLDGNGGDDVITGSRRADLLRGDAGNDRILGGAGADNLTGGSGRDRVEGGSGRDFIKVRDMARDSVNCGSGRDRVNTDRRDRVTGCEQTNRR